MSEVYFSPQVNKTQWPSLYSNLISALTCNLCFVSFVVRLSSTCEELLECISRNLASLWRVDHIFPISSNVAFPESTPHTHTIHSLLLSRQDALNATHGHRYHWVLPSLRGITECYLPSQVLLKPTDTGVTECYLPTQVPLSSAHRHRWHWVLAVRLEAQIGRK